MEISAANAKKGFISKENIARIVMNLHGKEAAGKGAIGIEGEKAVGSSRNHGNACFIRPASCGKTTGFNTNEPVAAIGCQNEIDSFGSTAFSI
jgi:hypothetical protein